MKPTVSGRTGVNSFYFEIAPEDRQMAVSNYIPMVWSEKMLATLRTLHELNELEAEFLMWHEQYGVWEPDMTPYAAANDIASC